MEAQTDDDDDDDDDDDYEAALNCEMTASAF